VTSATTPEHGSVLFVDDGITDCGREWADPDSPGGGHAATVPGHALPAPTWLDAASAGKGACGAADGAVR
jgi:hypothetical protein